eukprot:1284685-Pyramimonas_sp.AAC.1
MGGSELRRSRTPPFRNCSQLLNALPGPAGESAKVAKPSDAQLDARRGSLDALPEGFGAHRRGLPPLFPSLPRVQLSVYGDAMARRGIASGGDCVGPLG